jgi:hypothetical protein
LHALLTSPMCATCFHLSSYCTYSAMRMSYIMRLGRKIMVSILSSLLSIGTKYFS